MKGIYLLEINIAHSQVIEIGALGKIKFNKGTYFYVGSSQNSLESRVARHISKSKDKKKHWHIDYLLSSNFVKIKRIYYFRSDKSGECKLAKKLSQYYDSIVGFGCSDCNCNSHLFFK